MTGRVQQKRTVGRCKDHSLSHSTKGDIGGFGVVNTKMMLHH